MYDEARRLNNDIDAKWWDSSSESQYYSILLDYCLGDEGTYTMTKRGTGLYSYSIGSSPVCLYCTVTPRWTIESDTTYVFFARGLKCRVTVGTSAYSSIAVAGVPVDFREASAKFYEWLSAHRSQQLAESFGGTSISPGDCARALLMTAAQIRGPRGI